MTDEKRELIRREEDQDMAGRIEELEEGQERLFIVLGGPQELQLDGTYKRVKKKGMEYKVDAMFNAFTNGGVKIKLPAGAWVAIIIAIISGIFTVAAALV